MTDEQKALAIIKAWHDIVHNSPKGYGITVEKDWDVNTLTVNTAESHTHFGQMDMENDEGFSILIDQLYKHFVKQ